MKTKISFGKWGTSDGRQTRGSLDVSHERPGVDGHREHVEVIELLVLHLLRHVAKDARADVPDDLVLRVQLAEAVLQVDVVGAGDELDLEDVFDRPHRDPDGLRLRLLLALEQVQERLLAGELQPVDGQLVPAGAFRGAVEGRRAAWGATGRSARARRAGPVA